jgi:hypothetical protein
MWSLSLFDSYRLVFCGAPSLTRGRVYLLYMLLAIASAIFLGPSPLVLATIRVFYLLRRETSIFVTYYDSQGHGKGIRPRLRTDHARKTVPLLHKEDHRENESRDSYLASPLAL